MATSLAQQLKRLSVPNHALSADADKQRPSLLFDSKEAALLDREQVFSIGINGLQELENINPKFAKYEKQLFSQSSTAINRTILSKEENENLDKVLKEFLAMLSPFFLFKPAQKCLEWLIYRFYIHKMNVDDFVLCILPHHDSDMFNRALKLVKIDSPKNTWYFLYERLKENLPLPRRILLNRCKGDPGFLSFLCSHLTSHVEVFGADDARQSLNLYTILMLGMLGKRTEISEAIVKIVVTNVERGLKSSHREQKAANYLILTQLMTIVVPLKVEVTMRLLDLLIKNIEPLLRREAIFCLNVVLQNQKIKKLPEKLAASVTSALKELPTDEMSCSVRLAIERLINPVAEEDMITDEVDGTPTLIASLKEKRSKKRVAAVRGLAAAVEDGSEEYASEVIEDALLSGLRDESHRVVQAVLESDKILLKFVDKSKLTAALVELVEKNYTRSKWNDVVSRTVNILCTSGLSLNSPGLSSAVIGWLLVTAEKDATCARVLLSSELVKDLPILKVLPVADVASCLDEALAAGSPDSVSSGVKNYNKKVILSFAEYLVKSDEADFKATMADLTNVRCSTSGRARLLLAASLSAALTCSELDRRMLVIAELLNLISNQHSAEDVKCIVEDVKDLGTGLDGHLVPWLSHLRSTSRLPVDFVHWSVLQTIAALKPLRLADSGPIVSRSDASVSILVKVFETISNLSSDKTVLQLRHKFETELDQTALFKVMLMLMFELLEKEGRDAKWIPQSMYLVSFDVVHSICSESLALDELLSLSVLPGLFLGLQSTFQEVRIGAVKCLQKLRKNYELSERQGSGSVLKKLLKKKEFVMVDHEFASEVGRLFFGALPSVEAQQTFISQAIDFVIQSSESSMATTVKSCLKDLKIEVEHVSHELTLPEGDASVVKKEGKKKARVTINLDAAKYRRIVLILEVLESRKKLNNAAKTMGLLFKLLSRLMNESGEKADHCKQLLLACLCSICKRWKSHDLKSIKDHLSKNHLDVDVLRSCISDSVNAQVQQQALTLLAFIAPLYPEYVLRNAVAIFTFMGTNLVQLDNSYTFNVIISTVDAVMSAVVKAQDSSKNDPGNNPVLLELIRIFVDAREHIPGHRRLPLFQHLVERVGVDQYLWSLVVLIIESAVSKLDPKQTVEEKTTSVNKDIELVSNICLLFSGDVQLRITTKIIVFLQTALSSLRKSPTKPLPVVGEVPVKTILGLLLHLSRAALEILGSRQLIVEVLKRCEGRKVDGVLEGLLRDLILQSLTFMKEASRTQGSSHAKNTPQKFWSVLMGKVPKILFKATYLLPVASFLEVVQSLLDDSDPTIKLKALEILINKVQPSVEGLSAASKVQALKLTDLTSEEDVSLENLISKLTLTAKSSTPEMIKCRQMALYSIQKLCAELGMQKANMFVEVVPVVVEVATTPTTSPLVFDVGLTCLSEMCRTMGSRYMLKYLNALMTSTLAMLDDTKFMLSCNETTMLCVLISVKEIVKCFSDMLDQYITSLLSFVCMFPTVLKAGNVTFKELPKVLELLNSIANEMATRLDSRVLLPKVVETFKSLLKANQVGLTGLFKFVRVHISARNSGPTKINSDLLVSLVELFDEGMNLRSHAVQLTWDEMMSTETEMIESIYAMILPLTDNQFSSIFQKLFGYVGTEKTQECKLRQITFFHLADFLASKLQDLFIRYALNVLTAASDFLSENNGTTAAVPWFTGSSGQKQTCLMLEYVIGSLHKCFVFDKDGSFGVKAVKKVAYPIVEQMENFVGGEEAYKKRMVEFVVPCIGQLIVAAKKKGNGKDLNYQICLKSRSNRSVVKIASLLAIEEMARKLGQEYESILPETTPFLAELLEDDDDSVAQECHRVKGVIEEVIGELLNDCFK